MIKVALCLLLAALWRIGGWHWRVARIVVIPAIVGVFYAFTSPLLGVLMFVSANIIRLGDGNWSPEDDPKPSFFGWLTHDRTGVWTKGLHGLTCGLVAPLPRFFIGGMNVWHYLLWAIGFGVVSALLRLTKQVWIEEPCRGAWFAGVMFI